MPADRSHHVPWDFFGGRAAARSLSKKLLHFFGKSPTFQSFSCVTTDLATFAFFVVAGAVLCGFLLGESNENWENFKVLLSDLNPPRIVSEEIRAPASDCESNA